MAAQADDAVRGREDSIRARIMRRGAAGVAIVAVLVVAIATTIGVEVSHALTAPDGSSSPTTTLVSGGSGSGGATTGTGGSGSGGSGQQGNGGPDESQAPDVAMPGGYAAGYGSFNAVTCMSTVNCLAVGADQNGNGVAALTSNSGGAWSNQSVPSGIPPLDAVACVGTNQCVAVGKGVILASANGGATWNQPVLPIANATLLGVTCSTMTNCTAIGVTSPSNGQAFVGQAITSNDGGNTWTAATLPPGTGALGGVACPTSTFCVAVGASIMVSNDGGQTWAIATVPTGIGDGGLRSVSCSSALDCVAVGANPLGEEDSTEPGEAVGTTDGGATWHSITMPPSTAGVDQVSCNSSSQCVGGGSWETRGGPAAFAGSSDGGQTWQVESPPSGFSQIAGLACPSLNNCVVVGRSGDQPVTATTNNGGTWSPTVVPQS